MSRTSAGLLLHRMRGRSIEVLLAHLGGPFWARRDDGAWTLPKGELSDGEDPLAAACREFEEETGLRPQGPYVPLGTVKQSSGKLVHAWAMAGDFEPSALKCNEFEMEWPPRSGRRASFPEIDRVEWFALDSARVKLLAAQRAFIDRLEAALQPR